MKICCNCKVNRDDSEFSWRNKAKGIKNSRCKRCQRLLTHKHYRDNKESYKESQKKCQKRNSDFVAQYKTERGCKLCGEKTWQCLDAHHIDPSTKTGSIGNMISWKCSLDNITKELSKCVILCSNCHRKLHAGLVSL